MHAATRRFTGRRPTDGTQMIMTLPAEPTCCMSCFFTTLTCGQKEMIITNKVVWRWQAR